MAQHWSYAQAMGMFAAAALLIGAFVIAAGPEAKGIAFGNGSG